MDDFTGSRVGQFPIADVDNHLDETLVVKDKLAFILPNPTLRAIPPLIEDRLTV